MELTFIKKTTKIGDCSGVIIPNSIAIFLDKDTKYCFIIKEVEHDKDNKENLG